MTLQAAVPIVTGDQLTEPERVLIEMIREAQRAGWGEVTALIQNGEVEIAKGRTVKFRNGRRLDAGGMK